ncbi:hypothetical protein AMECASPLE_012898 [Ameca splendens]|uniref:Uncharacterized protein n=1 Tax=Ameca splendens TaxID=208324 RepID=A0ABV0ZM03_9TELE
MCLFSLGCDNPGMSDWTLRTGQHNKRRSKLLGRGVIVAGAQLFNSSLSTSCPFGNFNNGWLQQDLEAPSGLAADKDIDITQGSWFSRQ